jgi:hypothetical protein
MRLGAYPAQLKPRAAKIADIYGTRGFPSATATATKSTSTIGAAGGLRPVFSGMSPDGVLPETVEYRPSVVHRRAVPPGTEIEALRAASAVRQLHRGGQGAEPAGFLLHLPALMADILSLSKARKARARAEKDAVAEQNRAKFGRTKAEKQAEAAAKELAARRIEAHKRED